MRNELIHTLAAGLMLTILFSCSTVRKLEALRAGRPSASLSLTEDSASVKINDDSPKEEDTLFIKGDDGRELLVMNAVKDDDGQLVAVDRIQASFVVARFRNVAERHGMVDLRFDIIVPSEMTDGDWQLRLSPSLHMLGVVTRLDSIQITGERFRKAQLRGYQQYERFLNSIITDSTLFTRRRDLENFISRNIPELYAFKTDTSYVSDQQFSSKFGVTEYEAVRHYTDWLRKSINDRRKAMLPYRFRRYVKSPFVTEGIRLDTVITAEGGSVSYSYVQTIRTCPKLKKALITLSGGVYDTGGKIYDIPESDTLSFYISTLSSLADCSEKYLSKIVSRRVTENSICWVSFRQGSSSIDPDLDNNGIEIGRIKNNLKGLLENKEYDMDSITVTASASPEGTVQMNERLSLERSASVCKYFESFVGEFLDSARREEGVRMDFDGNVSSGPDVAVKFIPHYDGENWTLLSALVAEDRELDSLQKGDIESVMTEKDLDRREHMLSRMPSYRYLRENIYPSLRTVKFNFYLHRRGMVRDTVVTTELDTAYMRGVDAILDRDYEAALTILRPYRDYNTAIAYCSLDYNASAKEILLDLPSTPSVLYMLAVLYSREGDDRNAVRSYKDACAMEPSFVHRGNLDPEISSLVKRYGLKNED